MEYEIFKNQYKLSMFLFIGFIIVIFLPFSAMANELPLYRVSYRPDGGVSITHFVAEACLPEESETACMDRIYSQIEAGQYPYDDMIPDQLPKDRSQRDKWRGEKGRGIWVDASLVTKSDKRKEYQEQLDVELDEESPNASKVLRLQRLIEKVGDIDHPVLSDEDIRSIEKGKSSWLAVIAESVGEIFSSIAESLKSGFLALRSLVTETLSVGSPSAPAGITVYDTRTGEPYCVVVEDGVMKNLPGECSSQTIQSADVQSLPLEETASVAPADGEVSDTESPVIALLGNNPAEIEVGSTYGDLGAMITDNIDQNLGYKVLIDGGPEIYPNEIQIDTSIAGEHTIIYKATDQAGNVGTAERTIKVIDSIPQI